MNEVKVQRIMRLQNGSMLKACADITINDALLVKGLRVVEGKHGAFVSMPQMQGKDNKWYDSVKCLDEGLKAQIQDVVLFAFQNE